MLEFIVSLSHPSELPIQVHAAIEDGTAVSIPAHLRDFHAYGQTITFAAGVTMQRIKIPTIADGVAEGSETMKVRLTSPSPSQVVITTPLATGTTLDSPPLPQFKIYRKENTSEIMTEGDAAYFGSSYQRRP
jgi:hypothetical protein